MKILKTMCLSRRTDQISKDEISPIFSPFVEEGAFYWFNTMKLSVLKLDGNMFNVVVMENATVGELKNSLERTVDAIEMRVLGYCDIQWDLIWGNFCLCYMNQKMIDDKASLRTFGIQPDDQVQFIRHPGSKISQSKKRWSFGSCFVPSIQVQP